ncbi:MAG: glycosyltransferase family 4 protein [Bacteroidaceae bacterium]|nr:glycosyltransferase family 4 protein [Bacteroidaceae bacterium]
MTKKLFIIVNEDRFFLSHRKDIALAAQKAGWEVTVVCKDTGQRHEVEGMGLEVMELPVNPTGMNPIQEFRTFWFLYSLYRKNKDAIIHHVGLKTCLWGGLAAKLASVRGVANAISGLGAIFSNNKMGMTARGILAVMRFSNKRKGVKVIFQNHEDNSLFLNHHVIADSQTEFIKGSGVDLNVFRYVPEPESDTLKVVFSARMVKEKGVMELIEAAEMLRQDYEGRLEFWLCGRLADNADAVSKEELETRCDGKYIKWMNFQKDIRTVLEQCHIVAFPSYYREGVPKSLIDACAVGKPIVTTNSIGCKDVVDDGINGFLIPVKNSESLAEKLRILIEDKALRVRMGKAAREKAEREFAIEDVIEKHLEIYNKIWQQ